MTLWELTQPSASIVFQRPGYPTTLFPGNELVPEDIKTQILTHFGGYTLAIAPPWLWVEHFHQMIRRHLYQWQKLLASEKMLRDDDAIYNYDLNESSTYQNSGETTGANEGESYQYTSDTPDGSLTDIDTYMSEGAKSGGESSNSSETSSEGSATLRRYGNIGVMTSAQILGGYREATDYDAYTAIFRDLEPLFIGVFDLDSDEPFTLTVNPDI